MTNLRKKGLGFGKRVAPESTRTKRARAKLLKQWESEKTQITPKALEETIRKIHQWIADRSEYRISIEKKGSLKLFTQNESSVAASKKIQAFAKCLQEDMEIFSRTTFGK